MLLLILVPHFVDTTSQVGRELLKFTQAVRIIYYMHIVEWQDKNDNRMDLNWFKHSFHRISKLTSYAIDVKYIWNNSYIWTAVVDQSEEWSSQLIFQFKQLERRSLKKSRLRRDSNPWPPRHQCDAVPWFFQASSFQLLKWENLLRRSFFT